jgi:hypothetical protein
MTIDYSIDELKERFPTFEETYDGEDDPYLIYGAFGSYALDIINIFMLDEDAPQNYFYSNLRERGLNKDSIRTEVVKIFNYIDELFLKKNSDLQDILNTCLFEALMGNDYSYNLARKYFSKDTYNHYLEVTKRVI